MYFKCQTISTYFLVSCFYVLTRYLLVNTEKRRSLSSLSPHSTSGDAQHSHLTPVRKRDILRTCYKTIVGTLINLPGMLHFP